MNTSTSAFIESIATARVQTNPFPGLRPFGEDEDYLFFGRERQVDAMVNKLAATRFLAVVGTSGSGKSSLVNCGLLPALRAGLMARAGTAWRMAKFRPGSDPLQAMAGALAKDGVLFRDYQAGGLTLAEIVDTTLRMSNLGLIDIYEQAKLGKDVNLLVVVDQFEELFRYGQLGSQLEKAYGVSEAATALVNLLLEAKQQRTYPIYVVLTMRSDFLGDCALFPGLAEAINAGQYLVPRMTRDERREAISMPVRVGGAEISEVLLTRLVNDVGDNPDQLSILQHALNRTWARWQNEGGGKGPLDLAHYEAIGTMAHALDHHAERAYAELDTARRQQLCEKIFKALTDKATDPRGVRRPRTLGTLCALADATAAEVTAVIEVFRKPSRSFLMPPVGEVFKTETVIDISHESLMRVWERLKRWGDEEARSARRYVRLAETAEMHAAGEASLLGDVELQVALDWRDRNQPNLAWAMQYRRAFEAVMHLLEQSKAARDERRKAAAQAALVRGRLNRVIIGTLTLLVVVLGGWINRGYFQQQYYWRWKMGPSVLTVEQEKEHAAKPRSEFKECATGCPTMVVVPGGNFTMGSPESEKDRNEGPQHEVTIAKPFAVGKTEVTFAEWDACISAGACPPAADNLWGRDNRPVIFVSWDDAKQYVAWLSRITGKEYRLLSEAEWEYAARAGSQTRYSFGDNDAQLDEYAWYDKNSKDQTFPPEKKTHPVGNKKPNAFGLYDMYGNVWEWVDDPWHESYEGSPTDGSPWAKEGDSRRHVIRGGYWNNTASYLRVANRVNEPTDGRYDTTGFRLARTLNP
jgi:formylglycine-generating enzyme required for sulfatase activity/energy-coupling factor transporter ATP-binding protein EcfA2